MSPCGGGERAAINMERIAALWAGMDAQEYGRVVRAYTTAFPNAASGGRHPAVWKLRSCTGPETGRAGPDADFGPGEWLRTSAMHAYFGAAGLCGSMCADKADAKRALEERGGLLLGFANATPGVQSCAFHAAAPRREEEAAAVPRRDEDVADVIDLTEDDDEEGATTVDGEKPAGGPALGGSHWVLLLLRKQGEHIVGCELDPRHHAGTTACATSLAVLRSWGATRIRAGWEAAVRVAMGVDGDAAVPAAPATLQSAGDTTQCGPWVALLAHMASAVSERRLPAAEAAAAVAALHGNVCMYRALMYAACCGSGAGKRKRGG